MGCRANFFVSCGIAVVCSCGGRSGLGVGGGDVQDGSTAVSAGGATLAGAGASGGAAPGARGGGGFSQGGRMVGSGSAGIGASGRAETGGAPVSSGGVPSAAGTSAVDAGRPQDAFATEECITGTVRTTEEGLSYDGRWFVYADGTHVMLLDRQTGVASSVSRALTDVDPPAVSGDGNRVLFGAGPGTEVTAFVWDRVTQGMLASFVVGYLVMGMLSHDGRFLAFSTGDSSFSNPPPSSQGGVVVVDLSTNERWQASVNDAGEAASDYSYPSDVSDDGQRVVFRSVAANLIPGKPKWRWDVYLFDHTTQKLHLAARAANGGYADAYTYAVHISGDGRTVAFSTQADDVIAGGAAGTFDVFLWDIATDTVSSPTIGRTSKSVGLANLSRDGRFILVRGDGDDFDPVDTNGQRDAFVYDRTLDRFDLVTRARDGSPLANGGAPITLSGDGRVAAFTTQSPELSGDGGNSVTCFAVRK